MDIRNCKGCGKLFKYYGATTPMCATCMKALDDKYEQVKKYIYDNPRANINEVAQEMDVSIQQLQRWVREERLSFSEDSLVGVECESCGTMIRTGRFCQNCKAKMKNDLSSAIAKPEIKKPTPQKDTSARMRYLDQ